MNSKAVIYGFYYKGNQQQAQVPQKDVLQELQSVITRSRQPSSQSKNRPTLWELITSQVYFSNEKWQECLASHGIIYHR